MRLHVHATPTFKRTTIAAFFQHPLDPKDVAAIGILPRVQRRGNIEWPSAMELERELTDLYGARLGTGVQKSGDRQLAWFVLNLPGDSYVAQPVLHKGLRVLSAVMFSPVVENGGLRSEYVEQEKQLQVGRIRSLINSKSSWAVFRCVQEMFRNEAFSLYELGTEEEVRQLTPQSLRRSHEQLARKAPVDLYVVGDVELDKLQAAVEESFPSDRDAVDVGKTEVSLGEGEVNTVVDEEIMGQGWLVLGFRTDVAYASSERFAMQFLNGILGGFVHSKLFINVREKASLAYQASSAYSQSKGYLLALSWDLKHPTFDLITRNI
jgi:predicted Zn-dependent peptidase